MARLCLMLPRLSRYGGVEGVAWRWAEALAGRGHSVDFVCARAEDAPPEGVRPVVLGRRGLTRVGRMRRFAADAEAARAAGDYDLTLGPGRTLRQDILRVSGGPVSTFLELSLRAYPPGRERHMKRLVRLLDPAHRLEARLEREALDKAKTVVCVSALHRRWILEAYPGLDPTRVKLVHNLPDLARFSPVSAQERQALRQAHGVAENTTVLLFAGTSYLRKGLLPLVAALPHLPEDRVLWVAGGRGRRRALDLARRLGVAQRLRFLGRTDAMPDLYRLAHCFALPSFQDTCSNAVMEALASGCRVVAGAHDGASAFADPDLVVGDPWDAHALAATVERALARPRPGPFRFPEDIPAGIEPLCDLVDAALAAKP